MTVGAVLIGDIAYSECVVLGLPLYRGESVPKGRIENDGRAVIHVGRPVREDRWIKCFVTLNLIAPDIAEGEADLVRLGEFENIVSGNLRKAHGLRDGLPYVIDVDSMETIGFDELDSHAISCRLLFKILNIN